MQSIPLFHFWAWSDCYGWQHLGATDGYKTYKECYNDNKFHIEGNNKRQKWKILKLHDVNGSLDE